MKSANRLVPFELNGDTYYLNYSARASQCLQDKAEEIGYTSVNDFLFESERSRVMTNILYSAEVLILEGTKYRGYEGHDSPVISAAALDSILSIEQYNRLNDAVVSAIAEGSRRDVSATPPPKKAKAAEVK